MEYIWAKPRDREKYEKSDSRVGESATFVKKKRFAWDIRQKWKGGKFVGAGGTVCTSCSRRGESQVFEQSDECMQRNGGAAVGGEQP